jgi:hypothetical protein
MRDIQVLDKVEAENILQIDDTDVDSEESDKILEIQPEEEDAK